jgi:hypothetical protein
MAFRDRAERSTSERAERESARLRRRFEGLDATPIETVACRRPARVVGEVRRVGVAPRSGVPSLEVVLSDGTADAVAVFTGRRSIGGVQNGRAMVLEGVPRDEHGRKVMLNPVYTLLAD